MLTEREVGRIQGLFEAGNNKKEIHRLTGHSARSIRNALVRKQGHTRKPRVLAKVEARRELVKKVAAETKVVNGKVLPKNPSVTSVGMALRKAGVKVSRGTVHKDLVVTHDTRVRPLVPFEEGENKEARLLLKRRYLRTAGRRFIFSDEHFITTNDHTTKRMWVPKRAPGQAKIRPIPRVRKSRFNVPSVMIWASIGYDLKGPLVFIDKRKTEEGKTLGMNSQRYIRVCLAKLVPMLQPHHIFMQDGARPHTANKTKAYLEGKGVNMLDGWPPYSPDLNPIENLWHYLDERIAERVPRSLVELKRIAREEWDKIPQETINNYVLSFKKRIAKLE